MSIAKELEKTPLQSKKFIAYVFANIINKFLIFWMIQKDVSPTTIAWAVSASVFIDVGYILGQSALDIFVRMTHIKTTALKKNGKKLDVTDDKDKED